MLGNKDTAWMMWKVTDKGYKQCHTQQRAYTTSSAMSFIFICRKCKRPADLTVLLILYFIYLAKSIKVFTVLFYRRNESLHSWTAARETAARFWFIGADFSERADEINKLTHALATLLLGYKRSKRFLIIRESWYCTCNRATSKVI